MILTAALLITPAAFAARVDRRQVHQQKRIAEGVENGSLTPRETAKLETQEAKLQAEKHDMREDNGGKLTGKEKVKLNSQQNRLSREIHRKKH
jgi:ABC-type proline/glycine betaine transport system substrate-binding protein